MSSGISPFTGAINATRKTDTPKLDTNSESGAPLIDLSPVTVDPVRETSKCLLNPCPKCGWNGVLDSFLWSKPSSARPLDTRSGLPRCVSCETNLLILGEIARYEGINLEAISAYGVSISQDFRWAWADFSRSHKSPRESRKYELFFPSRALVSCLDSVLKFPRRLTTLNSIPQHSMKRSIDWIRLRLRICFDQHKSCALQSDGAAIPTRLIDVNPDGKGLDIKGPNGLDVKLRESISISPETSPKYAALSYCWGSYRPDCITTSQTIKRNLGCISWDSLPQTFRDAVEFTRGLGLRYLWIDSICIIQGDRDDWSREAGKMYEVYKGATITLAALFGADSRSGLRHMTMSQHYPRIVANLQHGYYVDPLYLRRHHDFWDLGATKEGSYPVISPLLKRAWTYQERIVSPRVVFFTESEVVYQCTQEVECECGTATDAWRSNWKSDSERAMIFEATKPSPDLNQQTSSDRRRNFFRTWRAIIEKYSALDITDAKDRLPALGAIAEQFQRVCPRSKYLAGLWSDYLLKDLLWKGDHSKRISNVSNLPTWSWASVQGGVKYPYLLDSFSSYTLRDVAEVVEATCSYRDNRLGILEHSTLVLRSRLLSCFLDWDELYDESQTRVYRTTTIDVDDESACFPCGSQSDFQQVYLFKIIEDTAKVYCLILRLEDQAAKSYSRLGMVECYDDSLFHAFEERGETVECRIL